MKKILDISAKIIGGYIAATGTKRKIKRYWGTETVDGIEVFKEKKYIYPRGLLDGDESTVKLLKLMDSYDDIASSKMEGIDKAWLYLNYMKLTGSTEAYFTKDWIAGMIEGCMSLGVEHTFYVNFTSTTYDGYWNKPKPDVFAGMTDSEILAYVFAHYQELYTTHNFQGRADSVVTMDELSKFLPFNDEPSDFIIVPKKVSKSIQLKTYDATEIGSNYNYVETTYSIEYTATRLSVIDKDTILVGKIYEAANEAERQQIIRDSQNNYSEDDSYTPPPPPPPPDGMYYSGRLRVDYYDSLTAKDALKLFGMLLDQDYQKKKTKWWKKILVIVIVVVVIVISAGSATVQAMTAAQAIAFTATMVTLAMTAVALYGSKNGEYGVAELAGQYGQMSGKVAMIAGIYAILQGAYNAVASKYAAQQAQQSVATAIVEAVKEMSMKAWNQALSFVSNLYQMKAKNEMGDIASEMEEVKQKSEEIRQEQTLANDEDYVASLAMLTVMDRDHEQLAKLNEKYYNMTDGRFDPTRYNIIKAGEFKGIGVFSVSYT